MHGVIAQSGPVDLVPTVNAASESWNALIGDDWGIDIRYGWSDSIGNALAQYWGWWMPFGNGRHFMGRILFNPTYAWYAGVDPAGLTPSAFDLLTVATHEMGHALSIGVGPLWDAEVADGNINVRPPLRLAGMTIEVNDDHLSDPMTLMYYGVAPGERKGITEADLMAGMEVSRFTIETVPEATTIAVLLVGLILLRNRPRGDHAWLPRFRKFY